MTPTQVRQVIENYTGTDIKKQCRETPYVEARIIYGRLCNEFLRNTHSLGEISDEIGFDHATILHYCNVAFYKRYQKPEFKALFQALYIMVEELEREDKKRRKKLLKMKEELDRDVSAYGKKYAELLRDHEEQVKTMQAQIAALKDNLKDPIIMEIASLAPDQLELFRTRAEVMIKSVRSIRTYENTNKREFNPAEEALKIKTA